MRKLFLTLALLALSAPALADGIASAQATVGAQYATPQAALVPQAAPQDTIIQREEVYSPPATVVREREVTEYVPQTRIIREEIPVAPQRTIIQREVSYAPMRAAAPVGCSYGAAAAPFRQRSFAPARSFAPVAYDDVPVGAGASATATAYGGGGQLQALRGRGLRAPRAQRQANVAKAKVRPARRGLAGLVFGP